MNFSLVTVTKNIDCYINSYNPKKSKVNGDCNVLKENDLILILKKQSSWDAEYTVITKYGLGYIYFRDLDRYTTNLTCK